MPSVRGGLPLFIRRRFDPAERYGLRLTLFALATLLVALPFSYLLLQVTSKGPLTVTDTEVAESIHEVVSASDFLVWLSHAVSFLGSPLWFYVVIPAAAFFFFRRGDRRVALYLIATSALGGVIDTVVKVVVDRPRPELDDPITHAFGKSFPSGHTMGSTVSYGVLLLAFMPFIARRWRPVAIAGYLAIVAAIALSRLGLGVHFLSDVIGGFVLGLAWLLVGTAAFSIWRRERGRPEVEVTEGAEPEVAS
jgi:undecaprenyl-diphosphatase